MPSEGSGLRVKLVTCDHHCLERGIMDLPSLDSDWLTVYEHQRGVMNIEAHPHWPPAGGVSGG